MHHNTVKILGMIKYIKRKVEIKLDDETAKHRNDNNSNGEDELDDNRENNQR